MILGITRNIYSAAIATLTSEGILSKSNAGSINFEFYLVYGIAQVFGGVLADRISPFKLLFAGIIEAVISNILMATSGSYPIMFIAWTFNGLTQFGVFPAIINILSTFLYPKRVNTPALIMSALFFICIPLLYSLLPLGKTPLAIVTLVLIISTTLMTTISQIANFAIPLAFAKYGKAGTVAGFLNLFSSFGIMLAYWLYGYISDNYGWITNICVWIEVGTIACISCFIATPSWSKFIKK